METGLVCSNLATLLVYCQSIESAEDRELIERIAHHSGAGHIRFLNGNNFNDHFDEAERWFLIVTGWTGSPEEVAFTKQFRKAAPYAPILIIAKTDKKSARDLAFAAGVDNYVSPEASEFEIVSKASRLKAVADMARIAEAPLIFGDISIWLHAKMVMRNNEPISLSSREIAIIMYLAEKSPKAVTRSAIEQEALGIRYDPGTNVVAVHVHRIRQKIGDSRESRIIQSIQGVGYRMSNAAEPSVN